MIEFTAIEIEEEIHKRNYYLSPVSDLSVPSTEQEQPAGEVSLYQNPIFWLLILLGVSAI
jgi:hypothetical protein